jgi:hypothetical protein
VGYEFQFERDKSRVESDAISSEGESLGSAGCETEGRMPIMSVWFGGLKRGLLNYIVLLGLAF